MTCREGLEELDVELAATARIEGALRLRLGQVLEILGKGKFTSLGFSSLAGYALERCEQQARWVEIARCLARRLEALPRLREALAFGEINWSQAELVGRKASSNSSTPENEEDWLAAFRNKTIRQLKAELFTAGSSEAPAPPEPTVIEELWTNEEFAKLRVTVDQEDAWLFEATRVLLESQDTHGDAQLIEAMLGEGMTSLLERLPPGALNLGAMEQADDSQARWNEQLRDWQTEAESRCEGRICRTPPEVPRDAVAVAAAQGMVGLAELSPHELDGIARQLAQRLANHRVDFGEAYSRFCHANGWRRLGYASESQYARERLGLSLSTLRVRRALLRKLGNLPVVAEALRAGEIGTEAAQLVARVATPSTAELWTKRGKERTIKHLREEAAAAGTVVQRTGCVDTAPPSEAEMDAFKELERAVVSGRVFEKLEATDVDQQGATDVDQPAPAPPAPSPPIGSPWGETISSLKNWISRGVQTSAGPNPPNHARLNPSRLGRVRLDLRITRSLYGLWYSLRDQAQAFLSPAMSWTKLLCLAVWETWGHTTKHREAYHSVYERDGYRCSSPVCNSRQVTPHHIQFRSAGGSDEDDNVTSLCLACHLEGVHGNHIHVTGDAPKLSWQIGSRPLMVVEGRFRNLPG